MRYKKIKMNGIFCCENCKFDRDCAQHNSAGDFRSEGGFSPRLLQLNDVTGCATYFSESSDSIYETLPTEDLGRGMLKLIKGKWEPYYEQ